MNYLKPEVLISLMSHHESQRAARVKKRGVRRSFFLIFGLMVSFSGASVSGQTVARSPAGYFEFHVDPWVSLHHFAYHYVREEVPNSHRRGRVRITEDDRLAITANMATACASLIQAYKPYIDGDLRSDPETRGLTEALVEGVHTLNDSAVRDALTACMPAYDKTLWQLHGSAGNNLLQRLMTQLDLHEKEMARRLAETLEGSWPEAPIRVDITPYANWAGAYTDDTPANITMSSYDEEVSGPYAFEILFHESAHTVSFERSLLAAADAALDATGMENSRYWHYVLFFATGRVTSEVLDDPDYVPYSKATGLTESDSGVDYYKALYESWNSSNYLSDRVLGAARKVAADRQVSRE